MIEMTINEIFANYRFIIELAFTLIAVLLSFNIYKNTNKLYRFINYKPLGYFSTAFLLFGITGTVRFVRLQIENNYSTAIINKILFIVHAGEFYMMMISGIMILLSLTWNSISNVVQNKKYLLLIINIISIGIAIITKTTELWTIIYLPLMITFGISCLMSYKNYRTKKENRISKVFFQAMLLNFIVWIVFFVSSIGLTFFTGDIFALSYIISFIVAILAFSRISIEISKIMEKF